MLTTLQITTLVCVALTMATAVAHALELPGKLRLSKEAYLAVQPIYYPGFTVVGGAAEMLGLVALLVLLFLTPLGTAAFWLSVAALVAFAAMDVIFWTITQPVNRFWLRDQKLSTAGVAFFDVREPEVEPRGAEWQQLRDRWEYSHVARAVLSLAALILLASAIAVS